MVTKEKRVENPVEKAYTARKEAEHFVNRWINDDAAGWPLRSNMLNCYEEYFTRLRDICMSYGNGG
ncbi:MAG: hypothetical protein ACYSUK_09760 [Planctomycetota bacterium]|jgi:hypothetical protein